MRNFLFVGLLAASAPLGAQTHSVTVPQGDIGRWAGGDAVSCEFEGHARAAVAGDCYFPIDLTRQPGRYPMAKITAKGRQRGEVVVTGTDFPEETIDLPEDKMNYVIPSAAELARIRRESGEVRPLFFRASGAPQFTLPLGEPYTPMPNGKNFGYRRVFNGLPRQQHTGVDYGVAGGESLHAAADGMVVLVADHFFSGQSVFVNHGDRLVTEYFHLGEATVTAGQQVKKGEVIGKVGSTGRSTGPHLHFGARWHGMRIDPRRLLASPSQLPQVE